jgi:hypothetical protein
VPPQDVRVRLLQHSYHRRGVDEAAAERSWVADVCRCRDVMPGAAIYFGQGEGSTWYLFLYAMQNPQHCCFLRLEKLEPLALQQDDFVLATVVGHLWNDQEFVVADALDDLHE